MSKQATESTSIKDMPFFLYFGKWVKEYKEGIIRDITLEKYMNDTKRIRELAPGLQMKDIDRISYQRLLNKFGENHSKQTVMDFHHHMKSCLLDAVDDGILERDPTRKIVVKAADQGRGKKNFLSREELNKLLSVLELGEEPNGEWLIWLLAKTGMRFAEAMGLTPEDFDFKEKTIRINKTWDYKKTNDFAPTKNPHSVREIDMDWEMVARFSGLVKQLPADRPVFVPEGGRVFNSTYNGLLKRKCRQAKIKTISVHGLRHTHASVLFSTGVSMPSIAKRLGHSGTETTQRVYLHLINELEEKDKSLIQGVLSGITGT